MAASVLQSGILLLLFVPVAVSSLTVSRNPSSKVNQTWDPEKETSCQNIGISRIFPDGGISSCSFSGTTEDMATSKRAWEEETGTSLSEQPNVLAADPAARHRPSRVPSGSGRPRPQSIVPSGPPKRRRLCSNVKYRYPWHTLTYEERRHYIEAELCLMRLPARTGHPGVRSRFDDLQAIHQTQSDHVHFTGHFLPFHRLLLHAHEQLLKRECGFQGTIPYWDETRDAGAFSRAEIFDSHYGFGGDGAGSRRCLHDGPFANFMLHLGPGKRVTTHCLSRRIDNHASLGSSAHNVQECLSLTRFDSAWPCIEGRPHTGGHFGVGGEMGNAISSPGDPIFYLHHAFIDKIWWDWQQKNLDTRLREVAGFTTQKQPRGGWKIATLEDWLRMHGVIADYTIEDVMDPMGADGPFCYDYA